MVGTVEGWTRQTGQSSDREALDIDDREAIQPRGQKRPYAGYGDEDATEEGIGWHGIEEEEEEMLEGLTKAELVQMRE